MGEASRIRIFSRRGVPMGEIESYSDRAWMLNEIGSADFYVPFTSPMCKREFLEYGNLILIEHNKLPSWGGVIDTPRVWDRGFVRVRAYSGEQLLSFVDYNPNKTVFGSTGDIISSIITQANNVLEIPIVIAGIDHWGGLKEEDFNGSETLLDLLQTITTEIKIPGYFWMTPVLDTSSGHLYFEANWRKDQGEPSSLQLEDGYNIIAEYPIMEEQGIITNFINSYGEGTGDEQKSFRVSDQESIGRFGQRRRTMNFSGLTNVASLETSTKEYLEQSKDPNETFRITAIDVGKTYSMIRIGNIHNLILPTAGFGEDGQIHTDAEGKVTGMQYNDHRNQLGLVVEKVLNA